MDMIEKVAKAICKSGKFETGQGGCAAVCMESLGESRTNCAHCARVHNVLARAAIKAMREPVTTEMLLAGGRETYPIEPGRLKRYGLPAQAWQAMIDCALQEES